MRTGESTTAPDVEELAVRIGASDEQAFVDFFKMFGPRLRAYFLSRGLGTWDAEDLSVTCMTDITMKIEKYKPQQGKGFQAWVFTIAYHTWVNWWRKRRHEEPLPDNYESVAVAPEEEPESDVSDEVLAVHEALSQLSETDQQVLRLCYSEEERSIKEISAELGIQPGTARVRRFRALRRLEVKLMKDPRVSTN